MIVISEEEAATVGALDEATCSDAYETLIAFALGASGGNGAEAFCLLLATLDAFVADTNMQSKLYGAAIEQLTESLKEARTDVEPT